MTEKRVLVDAGKRLGKLRHIWRYIGFDEINYTTTPSGRETLEKLKELGENYYVRTHHLLCSGNGRAIPKWGSTNAYVEDSDGNPVYSWRIIDAIFDVLLNNDCIPFVELGFMPLDLADLRGRQPTRPWGHWWYDGWSSPPKDYQKWYSLIYSLTEHCTDRYGREEAKTWYWELWNEPDLPYYWSGTLEEYCRLYDYTASAVADALPEAKIGGPATTHRAHDWLDGFLGHCVNGMNKYTRMKGTRLDFVSFHSKGAGYRPLWGKEKVEKQLPSTKRLLSQVGAGLEVIEKYPPLRDVRCILSECDPDGMAAYGVGDNPNLAFRNTEYYPSYVATNFKKLVDVAEHHGREIDALTWAFTFHGERCFEGTRTLTTNSIDKPLLNLFRMYALLGDERIELVSSAAKNPLGYEDDYGTTEEADIDGMAAASGNRCVEVLLFCHHDDWDRRGESEVHVEVSNLPFSGSATVEHYRIDERHSNACSEWARQGRPDYPTPTQTGEIKSREGLELLEPKKVIVVLDGRFEMTVSLPVHAISLLRLSSE